MVMDPDGTNAETLVEARSEDYDPAWSPGDTPETALPAAAADPCSGQKKMDGPYCGDPTEER